MDILFDQKTYDVELVTVGENVVDLAVVTNSASILMQRLYLRFKTYKRDLWWSLSYGIDYLNEVFGMNKPIRSVDVIIQNEILREPMVASLVSFESEVINYTYNCKFTVSVVNEPETITYYILTNENGAVLTDENGNQLTIRI
jgi:hypothetical protein